MNTYSNIYLHIIFSVKYRDAVIGKYWKPDLHAYITSVFNAKGHKTIIVGGTCDHVHVLIDYNPSQSIPDMMRDVKQSASLWINASHKTMCKFAWQRGYGVFSYTQSHIPTVKQYIANQVEHHKRENHVQEFEALLRTRHIAFDPKYMPQMPE